MKGIQSTAAAVTAVLMMLFITHNVIRIYGWKVTALIAPITCATLGCLFYILCLANTEERDVSGTMMVAVSEAAAEWLRYVGNTSILQLQKITIIFFNFIL